LAFVAVAFASMDAGAEPTGRYLRRATATSAKVMSGPVVMGRKHLLYLTSNILIDELMGQRSSFLCCSLLRANHGNAEIFTAIQYFWIFLNDVDGLSHNVFDVINKRFRIIPECVAISNQSEHLIFIITQYNIVRPDSKTFLVRS